MLLKGIRLFWSALRSNGIPALCIWAFGALIVYGYYQGGLVHEAAMWVSDLRERMGLSYSALSMALFGAVLPSITQWLLMPGSRRTVLRRFPYLLPFWAWKGIEIGGFYKIQSLIFGDSPALNIVLTKVLTDQFIYTPSISMISIVLYMRWVAVRVGDLPGETRIVPGKWYGNLVFPQLVACWSLWIPAVTLVYLLPYPLQLPLANLIQWLWSMMLVFMARDDSQGAQ